MRTRLIKFAVPCVCAFSLSACVSSQFYWGSYEDSLYIRQQEPGAGGEAKAVTMLADTISKAQGDAMKVGPGIYADYGYLLFKQGQINEAIAALGQESALYPESRLLMGTMTSRMQGRKDPKPTP